ncbi:MAG: glycoside hydrolase family 9 protein [Bacteriovoracaceae bacterium]
MKKYFFFFSIFTATTFPADSVRWIRLNQIGYQQNAQKTAVLVSLIEMDSVSSYEILDALSGEFVQTSSNVVRYGRYGAFASTFRLDFSNLTREGVYLINAGGTRSPVFRIGNYVYDGTADFLLQYMRQQRSFYNPYLRDSCHTSDGFIIYHPTLDSTHIDVAGGWHDAADYLQYVTTSATAVYQMLFAYQQHPTVFNDYYRAAGDPGSNGIPDILDEAKWGLDWLMKMNPSKEIYFNQIADDRDHRGFRLPTEDTVFYGKGKERPVYFINGQPQGVYQYKNRTTGAASTVAKFSSAFALGSDLLHKYYPEYSTALKQRSVEAYDFARKNPGVAQTAPCRAPYFYEEDNWTDDMELASAQLHTLDSSTGYLHDAVSFGKEEPYTPWFGADTARHYQWYPFVNLGHYIIAQQSPKHRREFIELLQTGIERVYLKGKSNAFQFGIPFIWCSNNLVSSFLTQLYLYRSLTSDSRYGEMEASLRDWLFGCNPWGTSMIVGLPAFGDTPLDPHSALTHVYGYPITGGLVDGPVRSSIFEQHKKYIRLTKSDPYAQFQSDLAVYHDDWGDYTNNEPTMDGTAGLTMVLSALESENNSRSLRNDPPHRVMSHGAIVRFDTTKKEIYLVFTGHEFADGGELIANILKKYTVQGSFFFTGDFYRTEQFSPLINRLLQDGHYLGAHSDKHLLYASWEKRDSLLIDQNRFREDLIGNYASMAKFGISPSAARFFLPPFEWHNQTIANWADEYGLTVINFSSGTSSNADYTTPEMSNFLSSDSIVGRIFRYESLSTNGLNGFILLSHIGTHAHRTDKFYTQLGTIIGRLKEKGYTFKRLQ